MKMMRKTFMETSLSELLAGKPLAQEMRADERSRHGTMEVPQQGEVTITWGAVIQVSTSVRASRLAFAFHRHLIPGLLPASRHLSSLTVLFPTNVRGTGI